jgi:prophage antirepressor-like protein
MKDIVKIFSFEDVSIRTTERDGEVWFCLVDVCAVIGVSNPSQAKTRLDDDEHDLISNEGQQYTIISESGLYSLALGSRKPKAKRFKRWVTSEVLPSIRKTGSYSVEPESPAIPQTFAEALQLAADQAKQLELQAPKVAFVENLVERKTLLTATQVAQKHVMSAIKLNRFLDELGCVYSKNVKRNRVFLQAWIENGYGEMKQTETGHDQALFTPAGEVRIHELMISEGLI